MIYFDSENKIFYLENQKITYALGINSLGVPEHIYFGPRVGRDLQMGEYSKKGIAHALCTTGTDGEKYNLSQVPQEFNTPYGGDYNEPSLMVEFSNGNRRSDFRYNSYEILKEKPKLPGLPGLRKGETLKILCETKNVSLELYYTICENEGAVSRSLRVINHGEENIRIQRAYSFSLNLPGKDWETVYLHSAHGNEVRKVRTILNYGTLTLDSKRGASSSSLTPFMAVLQKDTTENTGKCYGFNLIYSGSFALKASEISADSLRIMGGINDFDFEWTLAKDETFQTPEAVLTFSTEGLSGMSREFHDVYRNYLIPERFVKASRPVVINNWEATRFDFNFEKLQTFIDNAANVGIDTFVLDDGWFGERNDANSGLGDWFVNEKKLGCSMRELSDYVHGKGMKFGLWFEPEMINRNSELFRNHPEYAVQTPDEEAVECRNQLVLDLTKKEVRDYVVESVNAIIDANNIDYVKWDCNRDLSEGYSDSLPADRQKEFYHRQILGLYDLCERIVAAHPQILFEGCASGGLRFDAGILYWFPQIWCSDQTDAPARCIIQYGTSMCYPLSAQSCHVTASPNRRGKHLVPFKTRAAVAHLGATGYELDLSKLSEEEMEMIPKQIEEYHKDEALLQNGDLYRLSDSENSNYFAFEILAKDKSKGKLTIVKIAEQCNCPETRFYPMGLSENATYFVPELNRTMTGKSWQEFGLIPEFKDGDFESAVYHFEKA